MAETLALIFLFATILFAHMWLAKCRQHDRLRELYVGKRLSDFTEPLYIRRQPRKRRTTWLDEVKARVEQERNSRGAS